MSLMYSIPLVNYTANSEKIIMSDLSRRVGLFNEFKTSDRYFVNYTIRNGETAEEIADRYYDNVDFDFLIYLMNDMYNPLEDWPLEYNQLLAYATDKYNDINAIHHYESIATGDIVDEDWPTYDRLPVTNFEYEQNINEANSDIKLLTPEYATNAYRQMKALLKGV